MGVTYQDRMKNTWIREQTQLEDIMTNIKRGKWKWAGHLARRLDGRWTKAITEWYPRGSTRNRGRQKLRWRDEIVKTAGATWNRKAENRVLWRQMEEAFIQQWIDNG